MVTRLPIAVAQRVRNLAEQRDWTYSDTLAALIEIGLCHLDELLGGSTQQEELPLTKAS